MTDADNLQRIRQSTEETLDKLMNALHASPELMEELSGLVNSEDLVQEFTSLTLARPERAGQLLQLSFATLANYQIIDQIRRHQAQEQQQQGQQQQ